MTKEMLFKTLKEKYQELLIAHQLEQETVKIYCRSLSAEEAIGKTKRKDFPIIIGKDVMIQARYRNGRGQAFTDAPAVYEGSLADICALEIENDPHNRGIFIASLNAVMNSLGLCTGTVHCRTDGPEHCAEDMKTFLEREYPEANRIGLVGYQPALLQMLSESSCQVRALDLNSANIGDIRHGVLVEDGKENKEDLIQWADLILCTGSTLCNGTIVDYMNLDTEVVFFGITVAGAAKLLGLKRVCFADRYEG